MNERPGKIVCAKCEGECSLKVDVGTGSVAHLPDRVLALSSMECRVECLECGQQRTGILHDMDINRETGVLQFGRIELND